MAEPAPRRNFKPARRSLLRAGLFAFSGLAAGGVYGWQVEPHRLTLVRREMPVANLPAALAGRTLLQISDIHCGFATRLSHLQGALQAAGELAPDFIAYTGDFITEAGRGDDVAFADLVKRMPHGALGTFGVLGNHDYGRRWREADVADRLTRMLEDAGVRVLRNTHAVAAGLQFAGIDGVWARTYDAAAAFAGADPQLPTVALLHNPDGADMAGWPSWFKGHILSGHTHGGQVRPPFLEAPLVIINNKRYKVGEVAVGDGRTLYINPGLGYIIQFRMLVPPELTLFTLRRAP